MPTQRTVLAEALAEKAQSKAAARAALIARAAALRADGLSNKLIAARLGIGKEAVRLYLIEASGTGASADQTHNRPHQPRAAAGRFLPVTERKPKAKPARALGKPGRCGCGAPLARGPLCVDCHGVPRLASSSQGER